MDLQQDNENLKECLRRIEFNTQKLSTITMYGSITQITGMKIEATGLSVPVGTLCKIIITNDIALRAEVIGFSANVTFLMAIENVSGIKQGDKIIPLSYTRVANVGASLLGRVINAEGKPIDDHGEIVTDVQYPLAAKPINPLSRKKIDEPLDVGIRAINSLITVGKGQRLGIFAGSGVGKSVLLGMMTHFTSAHIVVVGLVGERGREVKEFIEQNLGEEGLKRSIVIAAPADTSPLMRSNCAVLATTIAEYFRDQGCDVLLIIDSLTRYAQAQREISLSAGELPATKGFTPSVFSKLSELVERSGNGNAYQGSITAFYTVLIEGDDHADPIADHARSILDGHIVLSRQLADAGHYPAIDIEKSISRVITAITTKDHLNVVNKFKNLYSTYARNRDVINVGMYQAGSDPVLDEAIKYIHKMRQFLLQDINESSLLSDGISQLMNLFNE